MQSMTITNFGQRNAKRKTYPWHEESNHEHKRHLQNPFTETKRITSVSRTLPYPPSLPLLPQKVSVVSRPTPVAPLQATLSFPATLADKCTCESPFLTLDRQARQGLWTKWVLPFVEKDTTVLFSFPFRVTDVCVLDDLYLAHIKSSSSSAAAAAASTTACAHAVVFMSDPLVHKQITTRHASWLEMHSYLSTLSNSSAVPARTDTCLSRSIASPNDKSTLFFQSRRTKMTLSQPSTSPWDIQTYKDMRLFLPAGFHVVVGWDSATLSEEGSSWHSVLSSPVHRTIWFRLLEIVGASSLYWIGSLACTCTPCCDTPLVSNCKVWQAIRQSCKAFGWQASNVCNLSEVPSLFGTTHDSSSAPNQGICRHRLSSVGGTRPPSSCGTLIYFMLYRRPLD